MEQIPPDVLRQIRKRSNRNEESRFPYKIWTLLNWVGIDHEKGKIAGCGWINETEFYIYKSKLCEVMEIKINTLNVNLKTLGFVQTRRKDWGITYWTNPMLQMNSSPEDFKQIRCSRAKSEVSVNINQKAVYLPLLEDIQLYGLTVDEIAMFKSEVIKYWEIVVGARYVFAVQVNEFVELLCGMLKTIADLRINDSYHVELLLTQRKPRVVTIHDFASFMARFGPFENITYKILQYNQAMSETRREIAFMLSAGSMTSYFSPTFQNCFRMLK